MDRAIFKSNVVLALGRTIKSCWYMPSQARVRSGDIEPSLLTYLEPLGNRLETKDDSLEEILVW